MSGGEKMEKLELEAGCVLLCGDAYAENTPEQNEAARCLAQRTAWEILQKEHSARSEIL